MVTKKGTSVGDESSATDRLMTSRAAYVTINIRRSRFVEYKNMKVSTSTSMCLISIVICLDFDTTIINPFGVSNTRAIPVTLRLQSTFYKRL